MSYQLSTEGYVIRLSDGAKIAITDTPEYPNTNPDYLAYKDWLAAGNDPEPADLDALKAQKLSALSDEYQSRIQSFPWDFGAEYGVLHLQLRDVTDQANWMLSSQKADLAVAAGLGAENLPPGIRTQENITVPVTASQAKDALDALANFGASMMAHKWALKDAINAAEDQAALEAIDIEAGWPA